METRREYTIAGFVDVTSIHIGESATLALTDGRVVKTSPVTVFTVHAGRVYIETASGSIYKNF